MKFLAIEKELKPIPDEMAADILEQEAKKAWQYYCDGIFREVYFDKDTHGAVIILECESGDTARAYLYELPLVEQGYITFEIRQLAPYDGFGRLMYGEKT